MIVDIGVNLKVDIGVNLKVDIGVNLKVDFEGNLKVDIGVNLKVSMFNVSIQAPAEGTRKVQTGIAPPTAT